MGIRFIEINNSPIKDGVAYERQLINVANISRIIPQNRTCLIQIQGQVDLITYGNSYESLKKLLAGPDGCSWAEVYG